MVDENSDQDDQGRAKLGCGEAVEVTTELIGSFIAHNGDYAQKDTNNASDYIDHKAREEIASLKCENDLLRDQFSLLIEKWDTYYHDTEDLLKTYRQAFDGFKKDMLMVSKTDNTHMSSLRASIREDHLEASLTSSLQVDHHQHQNNKPSYSAVLRTPVTTNFSNSSTSTNKATSQKENPWTTVSHTRNKKATKSAQTTTTTTETQNNTRNNPNNVKNGNTASNNSRHTHTHSAANNDNPPRKHGYDYLKTMAPEEITSTFLSGSGPPRSAYKAVFICNLQRQPISRIKAYLAQFGLPNGAVKWLTYVGRNKILELIVFESDVEKVIQTLADHKVEACQMNDWDPRLVGPIDPKLSEINQKQAALEVCKVMWLKQNQECPKPSVQGWYHRRYRNFQTSLLQDNLRTTASPTEEGVVPVDTAASPTDADLIPAGSDAMQL